MPDSISSFVNGLIAGAGVVLALMSYGFLQFVKPLENIQGVTTTELRIAILLGGIVCAAAVGYEFYRKKETKEPVRSDNKVKDQETKETQTEQKDVSIDE